LFVKPASEVAHLNRNELDALTTELRRGATALVLACTNEAMQLHLHEVATKVYGRARDRAARSRLEVGEEAVPASDTEPCRT